MTSNPQAKTLIILNPHAGSGRAGQIWSKIEPMLWEKLGELVVAITQHPDEVAPHLEKARAAGLTRVIAIGGDGTNHVIVNELVRLNQAAPDAPRMTFGVLPIGTGRDFARTLGVPFTPEDAVQWIAGAIARPVDLGALTFTVNGKEFDYRFLNIASVGASGEIALRVNHQKVRHAWTFLASTVRTLLTYRPPSVRVLLDGNLWYEGQSYLVAIANGRFFGNKMMIAPSAQIDDGVFDVVLVEGMPRTRIIPALNTAYTGDHIKRNDVHCAHARVVEIESTVPLKLELDGEPVGGTGIRFSVQPGALDLLLPPRQATV